MQNSISTCNKWSSRDLANFRKIFRTSCVQNSFRKISSNFRRQNFPPKFQKTCKNFRCKIYGLRKNPGLVFFSAIPKKRLSPKISRTCNFFIIFSELQIFPHLKTQTQNTVKRNLSQHFTYLSTFHFSRTDIKT